MFTWLKKTLRSLLEIGKEENTRSHPASFEEAILDEMDYHEVFLSTLVPDFLATERQQVIRRGDGKEIFLATRKENYAISKADFRHLQSKVVSLMEKYGWGLFRLTENLKAVLLPDKNAKGVLLKKVNWFPKEAYPIYYLAPKRELRRKHS